MHFGEKLRNVIRVSLSLNIIIKCNCVKSIHPQLEKRMSPIYLGAVVPDGFVLLLTILLSVGETKKRLKK